MTGLFDAATNHRAYTDVPWWVTVLCALCVLVFVARNVMR